MRKLLTISLLLLSLAAGAQSFQPAKGAHIVFVGNTFADRMLYFPEFELLLHQTFPDRQLVVRNLGWSADEPALQPRPLSFGDVHTHLTQQKADIIFVCFGMNEAFKGKAGLPGFEKDLNTFLADLSSHQYNGKSAPQLVLVSPVAHEKLGGYWPDPAAHNASLSIYAEAMKRIAAERKLRYLDLYTPTLNAKEAPLTANGIHLTEKGYRVVSQWMGKQLGFPAKKAAYTAAETNRLRDIIRMKNQEFLYRWRAVNGEYIYGRRKAPFGIRSFPAEMQKLDQMVAGLDKAVWQMSANPKSNAYAKAKAIVDDKTGAPQTPPRSEHAHHGSSGEGHYPASTSQFTLPKGFEINLFASEQDFPLEKPVNMTFDAKGRLWVALIPSYPHYLPGSPPNDRIVILEDTDGDGHADKHTVFADKLYLPLGFEFWKDGILVSAEPDFIYLRDINGDDKADTREVILHGFGTEDSHHALHAFTYGQDGGLYWHEGTFLHTQVETPYGPVRGSYGATYRYEPRTGKLINLVAYHYNNPWGNVFDRWGTQLIGDASDGMNYYAPPMTGKVEYPNPHPRTKMFTASRVRPTAGIELISSRHFPDSMQGDFLVNNTIGFQGIKRHKVKVAGSGIEGSDAEPMLQSNDPNFRPVDLKFGPDGALYVVDWFNPLIGHMQHSIRDPRRDHAHGRIWRITYKDRPLIPRTDLTKQSLPALFDNLKVYEDRFRYRTRGLIRTQEPTAVLPALATWVSGLSPSDADYEHHLLEALWLYQDFDEVNEPLLRKLLAAKEYRARAATLRVLRFWKDRVPGSLDVFRTAIHDPSPRVRLEAVVALSYYESPEAVAASLDLTDYQQDYYLDYARSETIKALKPVWIARFREDANYLNDQPERADQLLFYASQEDLAGLPASEAVLRARISNPETKEADRREALQALAKKHGRGEIPELIFLLRKAAPKAVGTLGTQLIASSADRLGSHRDELKSLTAVNQSAPLRETGYAALVVADGSLEPVLEQADAGDKEVVLRSLRLLGNPDIHRVVFPSVRKLFDRQDIPEPARREAVRSLGALTASGRVDLLLAELRPGGPFVPDAVEALSKVPDTELAPVASPLTRAIVSIARATPEKDRQVPWFDQLVALGKKTAARLPKEEADKATFILESTGTFQVKITTLPSKMLFDKESITVPAGRPVSIRFENPDEMPHNLVIIKGGSLEKVGKAADAMAAQKDGFEKNFVPAIPEVLYATPLLNPGESRELRFRAPEEPGEYIFVCTFPGHWGMMKGTLKIVKPETLLK
jgi:glucose/arabinose dehydrogenase/azurin